MTINYKGAEQGLEYRLAEIAFGESEMRTMERVAHLLSIKGWDVDIVTDGYAQCEVASKDEYKELVQDYKQAKRCIKNCEKYGF